MEAISAGSEAPSKASPNEHFDFGQHTGNCMGYVSGVFESVLADQ
jgi:hypothetical protein